MENPQAEVTRAEVFNGEAVEPYGNENGSSFVNHSLPQLEDRDWMLPNKAEIGELNFSSLCN